MHSNGDELTAVITVANDDEIATVDTSIPPTEYELRNMTKASVSMPTVISSPEDVFRLNVGGKLYRFCIDVVLAAREPDSLLVFLIRAEHHKRLLFVDGYTTATGEYYLERNARVAEHVLDYFFTGKLHKPHDICLERFREEILFWHLTNVELAPCCSVLADPSCIDETLQIERELNEMTYLAELRKIVWHLMENPSSSTMSKLFSFVSISFIFASVVGLIMSSMPEFQADARFADFYHIDVSVARAAARPRGGGQIPPGQALFYDAAGNKYVLIERGRNRSDLSGRPLPSDTFPISPDVWIAPAGCPTDGGPATANHSASTLTQFVYVPTDNPHAYLITLEYVCVAWFFFEFLIRFLVAPRKWRFLKRPMNVIDLFTVVPVVVELALSSIFAVHTDRLKEFAGAMIVTRILRVSRMARVFKLARYSVGLQVFGYTLKSSLRELCMLSMFLITGTIFFSTIMYFLERDEPGSDFHSIPAAFWWCIITVTTVGYGDCIISTAAGKLVAAIASIFGIIILAFPISMVVENFACAQEQSYVENEIREVQMAAVANDYLMKRYRSRRKACRDPLVAEDNAGDGSPADLTVLRRKSVSAYHLIRYATRHKVTS